MNISYQLLVPELLKLVSMLMKQNKELKNKLNTCNLQKTITNKSDSKIEKHKESCKLEVAKMFMPDKKDFERKICLSHDKFNKASTEQIKNIYKYDMYETYFLYFLEQSKVENSSDFLCSNIFN